MRTILIALAAMPLLLAACETVAKYSIRDDLVEIGIPEDKADCMADQLNEDNMRGLARYMDGLSRAATAGEALDALLKIDNPETAGAITASGISCVFAPTR